MKHILFFGIFHSFYPILLPYSNNQLKILQKSTVWDKNSFKLTLNLDMNMSNFS